MNKVQMKGHKWALDGEEPQLLLIPCMMLQEAKDLTGRAYDAIALAGLPHCLHKVINPH
jgi:hypothetical protein